MRYALAAGLALALGACTTAEKLPVYTGPDFVSYVSAKHAQFEKDTASASSFYDRALAADQDNAVLLRRAFSLALTNGDYRRGLELARRLVALAESGGGLPNMLVAVDEIRNGRYEAARESLGHITGSAFDALIRPIAEAWVAAALGDDAAGDILASLGRIRPFRDFQAEHDAYLKDYLGKTDEAEEAYRTLVMNRQLRSLQPVGAFAAFLVRHGRRGEALALVREFLENRNPGHPFLLRALADLVGKRPLFSPAQSPKDAIAVALLRTAAELNRDNARSSALLYARIATFLKPDFNESYLLIGDMLARDGLYGASLAAFDRVAPGPFALVARKRAGLVLSQSGDREAAIAAFTALMNDLPDDMDPVIALGDLHRQAEEFETAARYYSQAIDLIRTPRQSDWFVFFTRGIAYEQMGQWPPAEKDFLQALDLEAGQPQVLNYLGYSWIDRGMNIDRAKLMIESAVEQRPNDGFIVDSLGWVHYLLGDYEVAVRHLERAVLLQPGDPTLNDHLGDAYWQVGRLSEAHFQWQHAIGLDPEEEDAVLIAKKLDVGLHLAAVDETVAGVAE